MADTVVNYGKSKEQVALELLDFVARAEGKILGTVSEKNLDRHYILSTYHECWAVVHGSEPEKKT